MKFPDLPEPAVPHVNDEHDVLIELTAEGRRVHGRLAKAFATPPPWVDSLSTADQQALRDILQRAVAARTPGP